jgi:hypothetical protein
MRGSGFRRDFTPKKPEPSEAERTAAVVKWLQLQAGKHRARAHTAGTQPDNQEVVDAENRNADVIEACCEVLQQNRLLAPASIHQQTSHQGRKA